MYSEHGWFALCAVSRVFVSIGGQRQGREENSQAGRSSSSWFLAYLDGMECRRMGPILFPVHAAKI
jgi:hypothetical protein